MLIYVLAYQTVTFLLPNLHHHALTTVVYFMLEAVEKQPLSKVTRECINKSSVSPRLVYGIFMLV